MISKLGLAALHIGFLGSATLAQQKETATRHQNNNSHNDAQQVVDWLKGRDGAFVNPKLEFRRMDPNDPTSMSGIFAKEFIKEDEVLIHVPWHSLFASERNGTEWNFETYISCGTIHNLIDEFQKGNDSEFAPYTNYLKTQPVNQLPSSWSAAGKLLLMDILDGESNKQSLPPFSPFHHYNEWLDDCEGSIDDIGAAMLVISRADEDILTPVYDLSNHPTNGAQINMAMNLEKGGHHQTRAIRAIQAGEQLYNSYNLCESCGSRHDNFGTPEMLTDYGFVEGMPQRWYFFYGELLRLELDEDENGVVIASWNEDLGPQQANAIGDFFRHELRRLARLKKHINELGTIQDTMPANEWNTIWQYHDAIVNAMTHGLESLGGDRDEICTATSDGVDPCSHYVDPVTIEDDLPYTLSTTCRNNYLNNNYYLVETIALLDDSTTVDVRGKTHGDGEEEICLFENNELVVCEGFESDVYEPLVHFPAQFVNSIERVLIIGGGNTMALNEVLKYPSLELVVVVEEHEQLTRKSVEYFETTAHFDEDIVEWLFGPMDLSLLLEDGENDDSRFDLIIVENAGLSDETTVGALACLLDENGVVAGYGTDMTTVSRGFKYSTKAVFDDPFICKYTNMVLASHDVDFLEGDLWDHGISLATELFEEGDTAFDILHDYNNNNAHDLTRSKCQSNGQGYEIVEILELEGIVRLDGIQTVLRDSLSLHGYDLLSEPAQDSSSDSFVIVLTQGYLFVRALATTGSVGLDIHMWNSSYDDIKQLRNAVVHMLEAQKTSSFRFLPSSTSGPKVNGGENHEVTANVMANEMTAKASTNDKEMHQFQMLVTSLVLLNPFLELEDIQVGVVCGEENLGECQSYNIARNISKTGSVTPFWTCPGLEDENAPDTQDLHRAMVACERDLTKQMDKGTEQQRLQVLIIDQSAGPLMLQILDSMLSRAANQIEWFSSGHLLLSLSFDDDEDDTVGMLSSRRSSFLDRFRQYRRVDPVARAEFVLKSDIQAIQLGIVFSGYGGGALDIFIEYHDWLEESILATNLEGLSGVDLRRIVGGTTLPQQGYQALWDMDNLDDDEDDDEDEDLYDYDEDWDEDIDEDGYEYDEDGEEEDDEEEEVLLKQDLNCDDDGEDTCENEDDYNEAEETRILDRLYAYRTVVRLPPPMATMPGQLLTSSFAGASVLFDDLVRSIENNNNNNNNMFAEDMDLQTSSANMMTMWKTPRSNETDRMALHP